MLGRCEGDKNLWIVKAGFYVDIFMEAKTKTCSLIRDLEKEYNMAILFDCKINKWMLVHWSKSEKGSNFLGRKGGIVGCGEKGND